MLVVEGMGVISFTLEVTDFDGESITVDAQTISYSAKFLGFTSTSGIQQIKVTSVGPTPDCPVSPCGPLSLSAVYAEFVELGNPEDPEVPTGLWVDPAGDVSLANADLVFGQAAVSGEMVDLRARFLYPPFLNGDTQDITWCLDTDRNASTGSACGYVGADRAFTLSGELGSLFGGTFSFDGALASLDPCSVGSFDWDANMLRLVVPLSLLSDHASFNYVVTGTLTGRDTYNNAQVYNDTAPDLINFKAISGSLTSVAGIFAPFNGTPLCSSNREASLTFPAQVTGSVEQFPELGILRVAPVTEVQSTYFKTTPTNRQFRRGFFEFTIPTLPDDVLVSKVTLILTESRGLAADPRPPVTHEISYYQPADLVINTDDYTRTTTTLSQTIETDVNLAPEVFSIDVTDMYSNLHERTLGFRIKLAVDPDFSDMDNFGSGFGELSTIPPRLLIKVCHAEAEVAPEEAGTLIYTDTQGFSAEAFVPTGAVSETTTLVYEVLTTTSSISPTSALEPVGNAFSLEAYQEGERRSGDVFQTPITITLHYSDTDVAGLDENTLTLDYWNGSNWEYTACGPYDRHPDENWLSVPICHLSEYALFGMNEEPIAGLAATNDSPTALGNATTLTATIAEGSSVTYTWAFGDNSFGSGAVVNHTYPAVGVYTAVVTASNSVNFIKATNWITITDSYYMFLPIATKQ